MSAPVRNPRGGPYLRRAVVDEVTRRRLGDPNVRGKVAINDGFFRLREGIDSAGCYPVDNAVVEVFTDWERQVIDGDIAGDTVAYYRGGVSDLAGFATHHAVIAVGEMTPNFLLAWCRSPVRGGVGPSINTMYWRRSIAKAFFETCGLLGITDANPARLVVLPARPGRLVSACSDEQVALLKNAARVRINETRTPAMLALQMSGVTPTEQASLTVNDVDLPQRRVWVHDGGYRSTERWVPLFDVWCAQAVSAHVAALRESFGDTCGDESFLRRPKDRERTSVIQPGAVSMALTSLLRRAGVYQPGMIRVESIREWVALKVWEQTDSVEAVAVRLGMSSLDAAAHIIGYDWRSADPTTDVPPSHRRTEATRP